MAPNSADGLTCKSPDGIRDTPLESEKQPETGARRIAMDMHTAATRVISMEWDWEFKESFKGG
jgi:hypothetical protein